MRLGYGVDEINQIRNRMGFDWKSRVHVANDDAKEATLEAMKHTFRPEFINRLDDIIVFHTLEKPDLVKIVDLEISKVIERVKAKEIHLTLDATAQDFLIAKGYDPTYGARPMRRAVEKYIEDPMAEEVLRGNIKPGDSVTVQKDGDKLGFVVVHSKEQTESETAAS